MSNVDTQTTSDQINSSQLTTNSSSGYVSLLDSHETPDGSYSSYSQSSTSNWTQPFATLRQWGSRTFKYTRQLFQETIGQLPRTQDLEIQQNIQILHETKHRYEQILKEARQMSVYFAGLIQTQRALGESFNELQRLSGSSDDLVDQFVRNSQCQKTLAINGQNLLNTINTFIDKLNTLTNKTMTDIFHTIKIYENARIEYDAHRYDYQVLANKNQINQNIQKQYEHFKLIYEKSKEDLNVKFKFLDQNRIEVMTQQLMLFHNAIGSYFSVNRQQLNL